MTLARRPGPWGALLGAAALLVAWTWGGYLGDYPADAGPAVRALAHGDLAGFAAHPPAMGSLTVFLRAPLVALTDALGGGPVAAYRAGSVLCLLALAALAFWLSRPALRRGALVPAVLVAGLVMLNPPTRGAVVWGHPEDLVGGVLCVAAALAGTGRRPLLAGLLLGLAMATKHWAVIAVVPVLATCGRHWWRAGLIAAGLFAISVIPDAVGYAGTSRTALQLSRTHMYPETIWWPLSIVESRSVFDGAGWRTLDVHLAPAWVNHVARPLMVVLPALAGGAWAWMRARRGAGHGDVLALLALCFLLRGMLETQDNVYYHLPFVLALLAWETRRDQGPPVLSVLASAVLFAVFERLGRHGGGGTAAFAVYTAWALPMLGLLAARAFAVPLRSPARRRRRAAPLFTRPAP